MQIVHADSGQPADPVLVDRATCLPIDSPALNVRRPRAA